MRCFMPLKEAKTYHWGTRTTLRHLVTYSTLSFEICITCDQELTIYQSLRAMFQNVICLYKYRNRLDTYNLLTQGWATQVIVIISDKEIKPMIKYILLMLSFFSITQRVEVK